MKKIVKIILVFFLISGISLWAVPYFYKDKIIAYIKKDVNNMIRATFDFKDASVSIFSDFPNLNIRLHELSIDGLEAFRDTRLLDAKDIGLSLDLKSVIFGDQVVIKKISVDDAFVNIQILKNRQANYDIVKTSEAGATEESPNFNIKLKSYSIKNLDLTYTDLSSDLQTQLNHINHTGSGVLTDSIYQLKTDTKVERFNLRYGNTTYIKDVQLKVQSDIDISGDFEKYSLKNSKVLFNQLAIFLEGFFALEQDAIQMNITYKTEQANVKDLLSLIPKEYLADFEQIQTSGIAKLNGHIKGLIKGDTLPAFTTKLELQDGTIKYPDLPEKISNLTAQTFIDFKGGTNIDDISIDVSKIQCSIADNTATGNLKVTHPTTDPYISTHFKSNFDLSKVNKALKTENIQKLKGLLDADFSLKGALSALEKQDYKAFDASGYLKLFDFIVKTDSLPVAVAISKASLNFKPERLQIDAFKSKLGNSDFDIQGAITNYISYALGKDTSLKANITSHSTYLDLNEFISDDSANPTETDSLQVIRVPKNIDIHIATSADKVQYKDMKLQDVKGVVSIKDQRADLSTVFMKMMGGQIRLKGYYDTKENQPKTNIEVNMESLDIQESANSFSLFSNYTPILKQVKGTYFSTMGLDLSLDSNMNPIAKSVTINGNFKTNKIIPKETAILSDISKILKLKELENPYIDKVNAEFMIDKGTFTVKPFNFKLNDMNAGLRGTVSLEKKVNFIFTIEVPQNKLGTNINSILNKIKGGLAFLNLNTNKDKPIKLKFKISGNITSPAITPIILNDENQAVDEAITEIINDKTEEIRNNAIENAEKEAEKLLQTAEFQKDKLLEEAHIMAEKVRKEAALTAQKIVQDAGNDPLKKMAVKMAADKLKKEADKTATQLLSKASKKGDDLVEKARLQGNNIIERAKNAPKNDSI